jgi:protease-4
MLRPRTSSQPAAASLPDALGALLGRTLGGILDNVERSFTGASALWPGPWRF